MGTDIHPILEKKHNGKWIGIRELEHSKRWVKIGPKWSVENIWCEGTSRNYDFFGKLAGVRRDGPAPKGIPDDLSELSRMLFDEWEGDGHSHSHCSAQEYVEALAASQIKPAEIFLSDGHPAITDPYGYFFGFDLYFEEGDEYRVVFCFDN